MNVNSTKFVNSNLGKLGAWVYLGLAVSFSANAYQVEHGYDLMTNINEASVRDGTLGSGIERKTYFKNNHYSIPAGRELGSYYATWGVYGGRDYSPHKVPVERLSHVYVAFAGVCGDNRGAYNSGQGMSRSCQGGMHAAENGPYYLPGINKLQDGEVSFIDDTWGLLDLKLVDDSGEPYNQLQGMMKWKERNPSLKVIWSIGGWSYSRPIYDMIATADTRRRFIESVIDWLTSPAMGFVDGVDIDFEYPGGLGLDGDKGSAADGANYVQLMKELRQSLDALGEQTGRQYQLTAAIGVGPSKLDNWRLSSTVGAMLPYLDRLGLMTYDFAGAWDAQVGFNAALAAPAGSSQVNIISALNKLKNEHGVTADMLQKVSLGVGFYGRSHGAVTHAEPADLPGMASSGAGKGGTVEEGVHSFFDLYDNYIGLAGKGINGWQVYRYPEFSGSILYNQAKAEVISFTSPDDIEDIVKFVKDNGLKGVFSWQIDDDNGMLLEQIHHSFEHTRGSPAASKEVVYAPNCQAMKDAGVPLVIKSGMTFEGDGNVYAANTWATNCPNVGETWEQNQWSLLGGVDDFITYSSDAGVASESVVVTETFVPAQPEGSATTSQTEPAGATGAQATAEPQQQNDTSAVVAPGSTTNGNNTGANATADWQPGAIYASGGNEVRYKGSVWRNKWWTNGEPGVDGAWENVSPAPVDPETGVPAWKPGVYASGGNEVSHNGALWRNKWWTNGEPGVDAAWERTSAAAVDPATGVSAWQNGQIYSRAGEEVSHNGAVWRNKWWTNGEPGIDAAWEKVN